MERVRKVVVTRRAIKSKLRPPRVYAHRWKGHQEDNARFLQSLGWGTKAIAYTLGIDLDALKYRLYKKKRKSKSHKVVKVSRAYLPKKWRE